MLSGVDDRGNESVIAIEPCIKYSMQIYLLDLSFAGLLSRLQFSCGVPYGNGSAWVCPDPGEHCAFVCD